VHVAGVRTFGAQMEHFEQPDPRPPAPEDELLTVKAAGVGNWDEVMRRGGWDAGTDEVQPDSCPAIRRSATHCHCAIKVRGHRPLSLQLRRLR
jgi:hypothetical protein